MYLHASAETATGGDGRPPEARFGLLENEYHVVGINVRGEKVEFRTLSHWRRPGCGWLPRVIISRV
ncbi:hypothetical protein Ciccas_009601 [Cichlidogyrus casuarinus]|uniref:Uncharacterized protein n=1 Tax=Cichlidogyrus casuarinus TaxID=1844966 RepID=A0ABD2PY04_9PLAT